MKLLHTCLSRSWGGLEMFALQTVKQLLGRGIKTEFLCYPNSKIHNEALDSNLVVYTSKSKNYFHPLQILKIASLIKHRQYDLVHCGASKDLWVVVPALILSQLSIPLVLSKQMGSYIIKKDFFHRLIYNRVNYALAISNVIAKNLEETTTLTKDKILLLHNAIDTKYFDPTRVSSETVRNEFKIDSKELLIGMIARFSPGKGHEEFLLASKEIIVQHKNVKFMIVGEPSKGEDSYAAKIKELTSQLGIADKIIFTGFRKDTPEILAAMDIFVFPSHAEAFGIALAEALSMGKPTVCSNSDGVLDIAVDNQTSYLFEKQNWKDLFNKLEQLILSPEKRKEFSIAARRRAVELFDLNVYTNKLINIYNTAILSNKDSKDKRR